MPVSGAASRPVVVKICGITNLDDATAAVAAGADALGFVFHRNSPRCVTPAVARHIIAALPPLIVPVGVFVNEEVKVVRDLMDECGLGLAQLHGEETAAYCQELARPVLKAIRIKDRTSLLAIAEYRGRAGVRGFLLDAFSNESYGGTGRTADWGLAAEAALTAPVFLAGGLTPENVDQAIRSVEPYGVDVSSGVEASPGKKDHRKVQAFIKAARVVTLS
jgi:phosphoribosylanthranilate isomerase